jgi:ribosome-binding protein aMBF1 (putative translation factor)
MSAIEKFNMRERIRLFGIAVIEMRELRKMSRKQLAKKSRVKLAILTRIEKGKVTGGDFGLEEVNRLSSGMGITPYRLIIKWEQLVKDAGEAWW